MKGRKLRLHGNPKAYCEGVMVMVIALFSVVCGHFFFFFGIGHHVLFSHVHQRARARE